MSVRGCCTGWDAYTRDADGLVVVRSAADGEHLYIGDHYELHNGLATGYYPFGGRRVTLRQGITVSYLFADHLGSTCVLVNRDGTVNSCNLYYLGPVLSASKERQPRRERVQRRHDQTLHRPIS